MRNFIHKGQIHKATVKEPETTVKPTVKTTEVTQQKKDNVIYILNETFTTPETTIETYKQQLGKIFPSLFGDPPVTTVSDALREKYKGKGIWTKTTEDIYKVNGVNVENDYINVNKIWKEEIVRENEGQILADFQKLLAALFKQQGKNFPLIKGKKGTKVEALQKNMEENMKNIDGFSDQHNDGGILYNLCMKIFKQPTGALSCGGFLDWKEGFYFSIPAPDGGILILQVNKQGWGLHNRNDHDVGTVRPGLFQNS